jgi:hypothetical protein
MPDGKRAAGFYRSGRGRLPRTPTEDAPLFLGCFFPRSRSDGTPTDQGATFRAERMSARRREGDRGPSKSLVSAFRIQLVWRNVTRNNGTAFRRVIASSRIQQIPSDYVSPVRVPSSTELRLPNVGSSTCGRSGILMLIFFRSRLPSISHGSSSPSIGRIGTKSCLSQMYIL